MCLDYCLFIGSLSGHLFSVKCKAKFNNVQYRALLPPPHLQTPKSTAGLANVPLGVTYYQIPSDETMTRSITPFALATTNTCSFCPNYFCVLIQWRSLDCTK